LYTECISWRPRFANGKIDIPERVYTPRYTRYPKSASRGGGRKLFADIVGRLRETRETNSDVGVFGTVNEHVRVPKTCKKHLRRWLNFLETRKPRNGPDAARQFATGATSCRIRLLAELIGGPFSRVRTEYTNFFGNSARPFVIFLISRYRAS